MPQVGAYEAKTHLPRLLQRVERGERFIITRHGHPVAELIPAGRSDRDAIHRALQTLQTFQAAHPLKDISVRELIDEGRKY